METGETSKETLKKLIKQLDKGRECSIQESIYRILGLTMTKFSDEVRFVNTNHPDHREGLLKKQEELDDLKNGESIFCNSLHDYYQDRPRNDSHDDTDWENMSLAQFVSQFNVSKSRHSSKNAIKLLNNRGYITRRRKECVLRYFLKYEHEEEFYRALCILFHPFRNEKKEIHLKDVKELYDENAVSIEQLRAHFEKYRDTAEAIRDIEEKREDFEKDLDDSDDEESCETTTAEELYDFENFVNLQAKNQVRRYNEGKIDMPDDEYLKNINSLNSQQRKIFDDFVERLKDPTDESPFYLYIGGEAGTGKSFLLRDTFTKLILVTLCLEGPHHEKNFKTIFFCIFTP